MTMLKTIAGIAAVTAGAALVAYALTEGEDRQDLVRRGVGAMRATADGARKVATVLDREADRLESRVLGESYIADEWHKVEEARRVLATDPR